MTLFIKGVMDFLSSFYEKLICYTNVIKGGEDVKYFGGKSSIARHIATLINDNYSDKKQYVEPFCGAVNVASKVNIKNKILNDKNKYLIAMLQAIQEGWIPPENVTEEYYKYIKNNWDENPYVTGFVGFGCSFLGKFMGGYARCKKKTNYALVSKNGILKKMETLKEAQFMCKDFLELDFKDVVMYCDPPYKGTTGYCKILGNFSYLDFTVWIQEQSRKNIVLVSEYKHNVPENAIILLEIPSQTGARDKDNKRIKTTEVVYTYNR